MEFVDKCLKLVKYCEKGVLLYKQKNYVQSEQCFIKITDWMKLIMYNKNIGEETGKKICLYKVIAILINYMRDHLKISKKYSMIISIISKGSNLNKDTSSFMPNNNNNTTFL